MVFRLFLLLCLMATASVPAAQAAAADKPLSVGVLKYGTVNWQLDTVKALGLDEAAGVSLRVLPFASKTATSVALQAGEVNLIVSDWVWVMRQRAAGADFAFVPYSHALGALVAAKDSGIEGIEDIAGKRIGVAGGPLDKSWLVLRAWSAQELGYEIGARAKPVF
ncbi:MAG: ABC transporter substrate-binding protein, partial [Kiloniellaceae bacterium]